MPNFQLSYRLITQFKVSYLHSAVPRKMKGKLKPLGVSDSKQKSILNFFKTSGQGETVSGLVKDSEDKGLSSPPSKRKKVDEDSENEPRSPSMSASTPTPLTPEQRKLIDHKAMAAKILKHSKTLKIIDHQMGPSWYTALEGEFKKEYFVQLSEFVTTQRTRATIYPRPENVWEWTKYCPIQDVKVVILGQDPYHGPSQAHGLCFSVQKGVTPPPSLINMYKELESDIEGFVKPKHGHLIGWTEQGVLLLNAVLTVEASKANSHKDKGWEKLTDAVITWISKNLTSVVFLLWGSYAQKKASIVDKNRHHILNSVHPSPLSAHRGFLGCKHFSKCNELLIQSGKTPINWNKLP